MLETPLIDLRMSDAARHDRAGGGLLNAIDTADHRARAARRGVLARRSGCATSDSAAERPMSIETGFNISFVAGLALREKQIQQNYRPVIAVHKWFARRPGTLFRALALAEFGEAPVSELFFTCNDFCGRKVADPFMGGGTPLIEANRVGCDVTGFDINPMAAWIVREEIEHLNIEAYQDEAQRLLSRTAGRNRRALFDGLSALRRHRRAGEIFSLGEDD